MVAEECVVGGRPALRGEGGGGIRFSCVHTTGSQGGRAAGSEGVPHDKRPEEQSLCTMLYSSGGRA